MRISRSSGQHHTGIIAAVLIRCSGAGGSALGDVFVCGITGFLDRGRVDRSGRDVLARMADAIRHRGPDGHGYWIDDDAGIALAHRRLAIVDLSTAGQQPMGSASGRFAISFNGEVYNHLALRERLDELGLAPAWRGTSDTESLLAAIDVWGVETALRESTGMFALALWDRETSTLTLARDRMGEKPLYYGWLGSTLVFASELGALREHPAFTGRLDSAALSDVMRFGYVRSPRSIYENIQKLAPGSYVSMSRQGTGPTHRFWQIETEIETARARAFVGDYDQAIDAVDTCLSRAVRQQMTADVPLGAFLSGGIDSSVVAAMMKTQAGCDVRTFSIGFKESAFDESAHAQAVADHLGTIHTPLFVTESDALNTVPAMARVYDEPFADASQLPTTLLCQLTRQNVTVALSGDGGDELFGGYARHVQGAQIWSWLSGMPKPLRRAVARFLRLVSAERWDEAVQWFESHIARRALVRQPGRKIDKVASALGAEELAVFYLQLLSTERTSSPLLTTGEEKALPRAAGAGYSAGDLSVAEQLMAWDTRGYLVDDILVKVDRAAMAASLETRVPMLDPAVFRLAWSLPERFKTRAGGKAVLRDVLYRYVPRAIVERPKAGFDVPIDSWLRSSLRDWGESLLEPGKLADKGVFDTAVVRQLWNDHQRGEHDCSRQLWPILMTQAWLDSVGKAKHGEEATTC